MQPDDAARSPEMPENQGESRVRRSWFRLRSSTLPVAIVAFLSCLILLGAVSWRAVQQLNLADARVAQSHETLQFLSRALLTTVDAEIAARGYALSGDPAYLAPVSVAEQSEAEILAALRKMLAGNEAQLMRLDELAALVDGRFALIRTLIETRRERGAEAAEAFVRAGEGIRAQSTVRDLVRDMVAIEERRLGAYEAASDDALMRAQAIVVFSFLLVGLAGAVAFRYDAVRREAEKARRDSEALLRLGGEVARFGGWQLDPASGRISWSDDLAHLLEIAPDTRLTLDSAVERCSPEAGRRLRRSLESCIAEGIPFDIEIDFSTRRGIVFDLRVAGRPVHDANGQIERIGGAVQDISERKRIERSLRASESQFRQLADAMPLIVWTADPGGRADFVSKSFLAYTGTERTGDINTLWSRAILREDRAPTLDKWRAALASGGNYLTEFRLRRHDGVYRWHLVSAVPVRDSDDRIVKWFGSAIDIDDRYRTEKELEALAARLSSTLESISDAFFMLDRDWRFTYFNKEAERVLGRRAEDLIGKNIWEEFPATPGRVIRTLCETAVRDNVKMSTETFYEPLGLWLLVNAYPSPEGLAFYFQDVTERHRLQEKLNQSQRLEAVGQLTGGVAHDFNNLLTVILGNAEILDARLPPDSDLRKFVETTRHAAERGAELTDRLLAFSRRQPLDPRHVDLHQLMADLQDMLPRVLGEDVEIEFVIDDGLWPAEVDPGQFENAMFNLCINARDAMPGGGKLTIEIANAAFDHGGMSGPDELVPGDYVQVSVSDTGIGMTREIRDRVFDPFFTTKEAGKGSGLGLSMVYGFVKQSGGLVKIYSEPGEGTTVRIFLPRAGGAAEPLTAPDVAADAGVPRGDERILLVEDDDPVRAYAAGQLAEIGYRVVEVRNGVEALALLQDDKRFDLLFTDVVMPGGLNGPQLAEAARRLCPGLKVLFTSGYTENAIVHHGRLDPGVDLLSKPYRRRDLAARIRRVLDATG